MLARTLAALRRPALVAPLLLASTTGCGNDDQANAVLDAVVEVADTVYQTIDDDQTWLSPAAGDGFDISGSITNDIGGSLTAGGWRASAENDNAGGLHLAFAERVVVELSQWEAAGVLMSGRIGITRHSLDYGPSGGDIEDASRTTRYQAQLSGQGAAEGTYVVDVHAFASGTTLWTCGLVNDTEIEFGRCY